MTNPNVIHPHSQPDTSAISMPSSGYTVMYVDGEHGIVRRLDSIRPEHLADTGRRGLRIMEVLLEEALDNVRDARTLSAKEAS